MRTESDAAASNAGGGAEGTAEATGCALAVASPPRAGHVIEWSACESEGGGWREPVATAYVCGSSIGEVYRLGVCLSGLLQTPELERSAAEPPGVCATEVKAQLSVSSRREAIADARRAAEGAAGGMLTVTAEAIAGVVRFHTGGASAGVRFAVSVRLSERERAIEREPALRMLAQAASDGRHDRPVVWPDSFEAGLRPAGDRQRRFSAA